ncbi:MAG: Glutamyl-tRNA(Gln) amidotransferase subunit A [Parcubacteria group bacterium GW2011_GWF2_40_69]|nr:MAG: Glutamyl-tRNA(Gln) amidotransferase subunit A [Parcubacteria group bacterium GW2011_GWC1_39_12]KKR19311.1 MAG: Glutamyl-tRNA(Gln) amidotransferase subunit A [Parcubacteria group bacterium GW2011_GWF1_39_37]KKR35306.1 MAG: Glutamyl-tRNA(Gln) amidotransferase subunit A [Parcubacteria group bacterium GW2011_GWC2_40_10]KKR52262.1 MAG: Glutamyl-tRNA(Gln) amidotransferase subunit A [Parcubacteria group bacterium GW2011_GWE1_40_20]KKR69304.1 MAG: Glutamyl-tRNA(Gln) amidotransferase subunit A [
MIDIRNLTIKKARKHLDDKDFSARQLAEAYLEEISKVNTDLNAYLEVYKDVLEQADVADKKIAKGEISPLTGIPLAIKDNILISGKHASAGSKILKGYIATYDATVIKKLKDEGVVFIGRTNMDEFAMGSSTENSAFGPTKNPLDKTRVTGGSSGGSVATVKMNGALFALGSDTGGSVRQPASFCGVVGLKPTYGSVSRYGLMAMGSSLDVIGPITKTVTDAEIVFNSIKGKDEFDSTSQNEEGINNKKTPKVIGVPYHILEGGGMSKEALNSFKESIQKLEGLGYEIRDIKLPNIGYSLAVYYVIMPAEVSSNLARFDGVKYGLHIDGKDLLDDYLKTRGEGFGKEVRRRILIGTYVLSAGYHDAYYNKAITLRQKITDEFIKMFEEVDVIVTPTTPGPAFKIGEIVNDPLAMYLEDIFTVPANISGIPAMSVPAGTVEVDGVSLPLGLQIMAPHNCENLLFEVGKKFLGE